MNFERPRIHEPQEEKPADPQQALSDARKNALLGSKTERNPINYQEVFSPEKEVQEILKEPSAERRMLLKEFKEKLAQQKDGLAELQTGLIAAIRKNPDISSEELMRAVEKKSKFIGLDENHKEDAQEIIDAYREKHASVQRIRKEHPDDAELFEFIFRHKPKGQVDVVEGPMTLYFRCHDPFDYAVIYDHTITRGREPSAEEIEKAQKTSGVSLHFCRIAELEGCIIAENAFRTDQLQHDKYGTASSIYKHEEQHAIMRLFEEELEENSVDRYLETIEDPEAFRRAFEAYLTRRREHTAEPQAADELLAYFKEGRLRQGEEYLHQPADEDGIYDFLEGDRKRLRKSAEAVKKKGEQDFRTDIQLETMEEVYGEKYRQRVREGVEAIERLAAGGYTKNEVIALLMPEPLSRWKKVAERQLGVR